MIMEAVTAGTPVLASRIDGNIGMLGEDYEGYFPVGDAAALAALIGRCRRGRPHRRGAPATSSAGSPPSAACALRSSTPRPNASRCAGWPPT